MPHATTGFVFDEHFLRYDVGAHTTIVTQHGSFEVEPEPHQSSTITRRTKHFFDGLHLTQQMQHIPSRMAGDEELLYYHTSAYLSGLRAYVTGGPGAPSAGAWGSIEASTHLGQASFDAALFSAGGAMNATSSVLNGDVRNAYALLRPPGHHATKNQAMGFCIFNNAALAAHHARKVHGLDRVMIVDWDVHHGNGTQDAFYQDPNVLFVSLHQQNWYPRLSGELEQIGSGAGAGYTVNIPLPPGTGDRGYRAAFEQLVLPIGRQFQPQLIIISAGQDANWLDPLAHMMMTMAGFRSISQLMLELANDICDGRLVVLQEGGYSAEYVPYCNVAVVEPLLAINLNIVDPDAGTSELERCTSIFSQDTHNALVRARTWHKNWWHI